MPNRKWNVCTSQTSPNLLGRLTHSIGSLSLFKASAASSNFSFASFSCSLASRYSAFFISYFSHGNFFFIDSAWQHKSDRSTHTSNRLFQLMTREREVEETFAKRSSLCLTRSTSLSNSALSVFNWSRDPLLLSTAYYRWQESPDLFPQCIVSL